MQLNEEFCRHLGGAGEEEIEANRNFQQEKPSLSARSAEDRKGKRVHRSKLNKPGSGPQCKDAPS